MYTSSTIHLLLWTKCWHKDWEWSLLMSIRNGSSFEDVSSFSFFSAILRLTHLYIYVTAKEDSTDRNTLVFKLDVACKRTKSAQKSSTVASDKLASPYDALENGLVTSSKLEWVPQGEQSELPGLMSKPPAALNGDIMLAKLRPGQRIEMQLHAVKGVGKDHAKFSPVGMSIHPSLTHTKRKKPTHMQPQRRHRTVFCRRLSLPNLSRHTSRISSRHALFLESLW